MSQPGPAESPSPHHHHGSLPPPHLLAVVLVVMFQLHLIEIHAAELGAPHGRAFAAENASAGVQATRRGRVVLVKIGPQRGAKPAYTPFHYGVAAVLGVLVAGTVGALLLLVRYVLNPPRLPGTNVKSRTIIKPKGPIRAPQRYRGVQPSAARQHSAPAYLLSPVSGAPSSSRSQRSPLKVVSRTSPSSSLSA